MGEKTEEGRKKGEKEVTGLKEREGKGKRTVRCWVERRGGEESYPSQTSDEVRVESEEEDNERRRGLVKERGESKANTCKEGGEETDTSRAI
eukprot:756055-Hanusia_phi.AAC.3